VLGEANVGAEVGEASDGDEVGKVGDVEDVAERDVVLNAVNDAPDSECPSADRVNDLMIGYLDPSDVRLVVLEP
jgi:hypothetical protein